VEVRWHDEGDHVALEVEDDGPGLPDAVREALFEPFQVGPGGGTGLGLPIARQLVIAHGGTIDVRSSREGSIFTVTLPTADETGNGERDDTERDDRERR
jgi:signal transduction histidine kinase